MIAPFLALVCCSGATLQSQALDLIYVTKGDRSQSLDLFFPSGEAKKRPLVIWVHGGGWRTGSKEGGPWRALIREGFAVASINYRLSGDATFPAQIEDCKAAVRYLRANAGKFGLDKDRFGAWGSSAGGHLVALLGTSGGVKELEGASLGNEGESSLVQAVCDWYGPTDFIAYRVGEQAKSAQTPEALLLGGAIDTKEALAKMASPITYISKDDPPFLIAHGLADRTVPYNQSELLHQALKKSGVSSELVLVPGAGHGNLGNEIQAKVIAFFKEHLMK